MAKVLIFQVGIKGLENKIWRKLEILDTMTIADLVYTILASFEVYANDYFRVTINDCEYDSVNEIYYNKLDKTAMDTKLKELKFDEK